MQEIATLISTLGFPVVMVLVMIVGYRYMFDKFMLKSEQEMAKHAEEVNSMTTALNNNTVVLQKLCDKLNADVSRGTLSGAGTDIAKS